MSLLREIQDSAVNSKVELSITLRKCKILAARLGNPEFKTWVDNELNGFDDHNDVPSYRKFKVFSKGHFFGPFQSGIKNADIPMGCIPEKFRDNLSYCWLMQPVAALEALVSGSKGGSLEEPWNPDLVSLVGQNIYDSFNCVQAWKVIPSTGIVAALDAIRNKILSFVLEIEAENPAAGEAEVKSNPVPQDKVQHIFNTYISGNVQNLSTGNSRISHKVTTIIEYDSVFDDLINAITKAPLNESLIKDIASTVKEMKENQDNPNFREKYCNFMSFLSDHMQVLGPIVAPYLTSILTLLK